MSQFCPDALILNALLERVKGHYFGFHTPGHHNAQGLHPRLVNAWNDVGLKLDLSELPGLDNLAAPTEIIDQAQNLAAETFRVEKTWFLINGSTVGICAAIMATCRPGDQILIPRNIHQSVLSGIILVGARPVMITPQFDPIWGLAYPINSKQIQAALQQYPDIKAVLVTSPTYEGLCPDLLNITKLVHDWHIPLIVDEAHGSHFQFHAQFPMSAIQAGADVIIQSTHKTLSAFTQAAMLHQQGSRVSQARISQCLRILQSSSPSYLLLASLDMARDQMTTEGESLWNSILELATDLQQSLEHIPKAIQFSTQFLPPNITLDPTRITLGTWPLQITGYRADDYLDQYHQVTAELPTVNYLTFILGLGHTRDDINTLVKGWQDLITTINDNEQDKQLYIQEWETLHQMGQLSPNHESITTPLIEPRSAFFAAHQQVPQAHAINQISAEWICPYPPGIPWLFPGELITESILAQLIAIQQAGGTITGASDPTLQTLMIIEPDQSSDIESPRPHDWVE